jgi:RNA polymerase sigma-70 factor, ECF subfamily
MTLVHEDGELIQKAKQDPQFFGVLYQKYAKQVFNYFWFRTGYDDETGQELMQETFLRAFQQLKQFTDRGCSYLAYLLKIAHNLLVNYFRKQKPIPLDTIEIPYDNHQAFEDQFNRSRLWSAVRKLNPLEQEALKLFYQDHLSIKQLASVLQKTENSCKLILSRSRKKLVKIIDIPHPLPLIPQLTPFPASGVY